MSRFFTREEEAEQFRLFKDGTEGESRAARDAIVANYRLLVLKIAHKFALLHLLPFDDLVQEGHIGLLRAMDKFDLARGNRFTTVAPWWIRQSIQTALTKTGRLITIPRYRTDKGYQLARIQDADSLTEEEIAERLHCSTESLQELRECESFVVFSLDAPVGFEEFGPATNHDVIGDESVRNAASNLFESERREKLTRLLRSYLTEKERAVLEKRFGFRGDSASLTEIGRQLNLTRERIRQIESKALRKLRLPSALRELEQVH